MIIQFESVFKIVTDSIMDKKYEENPDLVKSWEDLKIAEFKGNFDKKYVIDTPPAYPSGDFHLGNTLNWCWIDVIARYQRMSGKDVFFPQGWDVHGLPTETKVEKASNIKCDEVERDKWVEMCKEWTEVKIDGMKSCLKRLGISIQWDSEFRTSDDKYMKIVQLSFLDLHKKGFAYRGKYPVNFCTTCRTAISDAEVEYVERDTKLNYVLFDVEGKEKKVEIATTRPELLASCVAVAVNPDDEKNKVLIGKKFIVPLFNRKVEVIQSKEVDPEFGSGVVMICSFGDRQDVDWILKNNLQIVESIDENGRMIVEPYKGMTTGEARKEIIKKLEEEKRRVKQANQNQNVGTCWRCHKPIEILNREQWFIAVTKFKDKVVKGTEEAKWIPDFMKHRQIDWTKNMNWDWCVSRKKVFGTPIPVWYCKKCGKIVLAEESEMPVDPVKKEKVCECGEKLIPEKETFDTWVDSSFSIAYVCDYPNEKFKKMYPADLQPNGSDIIRTWDYYLMLRHLLAFDEIPYKNCLINGMVLGADGKKMSKSLDNFVSLKELIEKFPADAIRYWTCLAAPGSSIIFSEDQLKRGTYLLTKLWNSAKFCSQFIEEMEERKEEELTLTDKWIMNRLSETTVKMNKYLDEYEIAKALAELEQFFVNDFCDNYLEFVKYRLYNEVDEKSAKSTLRKILLAMTKLFAPFFPYISDSIYSELFKEKKSVHLEEFPIIKFEDKESAEIGELLKKIVSEVRKWKISNQLSLGKEISKVCISAGAEEIEKLKLIERDIKGVGRAKEIEIKEGEFLVECVV